MPDIKSENYIALPMLALRGVNVYPSMLMTFDVERKASLEALRIANNFDRCIFLVAQTDSTVDIPDANDLFKIGTVAKIRQQISAQNGVSRVMVEGLFRAKIIDVKKSGTAFSAIVEKLEDKNEKISNAKIEAAVRNCISLYEEYLQLSGEFTPESVLNIISKTDATYICDYIAQNIPFLVEDKQLLLEELHPYRRLISLSRLINRELDIMTLEKELNDSANDNINKNQREYFLREEMKIIQQELGEDLGIDDIAEYKNKIETLPVTNDVKEKLLKEVSHLSKQPFGSSEASVIRSYLDTCLEIPWGKKTNETLDIQKARKILDKDHFGLEKVKERIIEYLAVKKLSPDIKGGLICLVSPPGCGKTSIAMSIAKAVNRNPVRISLGGVHDEAEIRGHRKTYVGSMPGRIINGIIQSKSSNPLMILDEIDKLGNDYRGDPAAALLETLDPEQNSSFRDNFLEIPFDLSETFFITTANTTDTIPAALLDRMEIIEIGSYTDEEKVQIAKKHLIPKQRKKHGLNSKELKINDDALRIIISLYTRESGVRVLEREIAHICRKCAYGIADGNYSHLIVNENNIKAILGPAKYVDDEKRLSDSVGLARGLAWTSVGGEVLDVEVAVLEGTGKLELTGNLGDVMKESAKTALTVVRSCSSFLNIEPDFYKNKDIHIHFPEGAVPKDGPSAGITIATAIASALSNIPVRYDVAMTGEISLRGKVLAIGGLREKTMAALRSGVKTVIIPKDNESSLEEIDPLVRDKMRFIQVNSFEEVISSALRFVPDKENIWKELTSINVNSSNLLQNPHNLSEVVSRQ